MVGLDDQCLSGLGIYLQCFVCGFQATRKLRRIPETRAIPIIIMSGNEQATEEFWVLRIGANDFLAKPFTRFEVYRRIERILYNNEII